MLLNKSIENRLSAANTQHVRMLYSLLLTIVVEQIHNRSKWWSLGILSAVQRIRFIPRLHDEAGSTSWLSSTTARRALVVRSSSQLVEPAAWMCLILQAFMQMALRAHDQRSSCARRALVVRSSSSSQLHRVNGVLHKTTPHERVRVVWSMRHGQ